MECRALILLDTHALVWMDAASKQLGSNARQIIDAALADDVLAVSALSFWEIGMLETKGRLSLQMDLIQWRAELLQGGLNELPFNGQVAISAAQLKGFHGDPADRLIVATAQVADARLITADKAILAWSGELETLDARH